MHHGIFDLNCISLTLPGIRVLVHTKPSKKRTTKSPHAGADGWYVGLTLESYRCYILTRFPTKVQMPLASSNDLILAGLQENLHALHHPLPGSAWHHPRTVTMMPCLTALVSILTSLLATPSRPSPPAPDTTNGHITSPDPPLIVALPAPVQKTAPLPDPPLRVPLHAQHSPAHPPTPPRLSPLALCPPTRLAPRSTSAPAPLAPVAAAHNVNAPLQRGLNQHKPCIPQKAGMSLMSPVPRFATHTAPVPTARASNMSLRVSWPPSMPAHTQCETTPRHNTLSSTAMPLIPTPAELPSTRSSANVATASFGRCQQTLKKLFVSPKVLGHGQRHKHNVASSSTCLQFPAAAKPRICVLFPQCVPKSKSLSRPLDLRRRQG